LLISAGRATSSNISSLQGQQQQTLDSGGGQMTGQTDGWMEMDGRTLDSFIEPAPYATRAVSTKRKKKIKGG